MSKVWSKQGAEGFANVEQIVRQYFATPQTVPAAEELKGWSLQIRLWHEPAFHPSQSWAIFQRRGRVGTPTLFKIRSIVWHRLVDYRRFCEPLEGLAKGWNPQPTIEVRDAPLDAEEFEKRIASLREIPFPPLARQPCVLDGECFGVALEGINLEWWCDGPESWQPFVQQVAELRQWLNDVLATATSPE